jgi:tetratricopeptide (TPR) repeat protein
MTSADESQIDQELQELQERAGGLIPKCRFAGSSRLYGELRRRGRVEHRAHAYVLGTFFQMDQAQYLFEFHTMRERAIELIAILENEEKIRQIQSDFSREQYDYLVYSMSSCAYENLAEATGQLEGYNSDGMHACITDGIQICRRTGKIGCVSCFREYACDVYLAADDADIAGHQCRLVMEQEGAWSDRGDRRWLATSKLAWLQALQGRFDEAVETMDRALEFTEADAVSLKFEARMRTLLARDTIRLAAGLPAIIDSDPAFAQMPSAEECPVFEHTLDLNAALMSAQQENWDEAALLLSHWDQRLQKCNGTHLWFETRLRLIAVRKMSGQRKQAETLARQLEQRARSSNDYLTLRRLELLLNTKTPSPLAIAAEPRRLETTDTQVTGAESSPTIVDGAEMSPEATTEQTPTPLSKVIDSLRARMNDLLQEPTPESFESIRADVLAIRLDEASHPDDVGGLLHLMGYLVGSGDDGEAVWKWANAIAAPHRGSAVVLSVLGVLGDALRTSPNEGLAEKITADRTEQLFRKSLELDATKPRNFLRAGDHFASEDNQGEAERCFARAFRLDRVEGNIVRRLADLYSSTERPRDALHVLDLSLREGSSDSQVAFDAAMLAFRLKQFDATLTYLEKYDQLAGSSLWTNYYRGVCHYEQGDFQLCLECLDREQSIADSTGWHLELMRGVAKARLGDESTARSHLTMVMDTPLFEIDFLSSAGIAELLQRLCVVAEEVFKDVALLVRLESRLLRSGLMPDSWFQRQRDAKEQKPVENVRLYRCLIHQPLDETWETDPDRLSGQENWTVYITEWGVLAETEDAAREVATRYQALCYHLPALVPEVFESEEKFTDVPGAVWQAGRIELTDDDPDDEFSDGQLDFEL